MPLSPESEKVVEALWKHITELHAEWKSLLQLFGVSQAQSDFLNKVAGAFFDTVYQTLIRDILLGISRLTDPLSTAGKDNLVLERLATLPEVQADSALSTKVAVKLSEVKGKATSIRDYRNKYLAHLDLAASLGPGSDVLPGIKRLDIDAVLDGFADLFNLIEQALREQYRYVQGSVDPRWPRVPLEASGRCSVMAGAACRGTTAAGSSEGHRTERRLTRVCSRPRPAS